MLHIVKQDIDFSFCYYEVTIILKINVKVRNKNKGVFYSKHFIIFT